jgi:hypothetical protein
MDAPSRVSVRDTLAQQLCSVFHRAHMSSYIYRTEGPQFRSALLPWLLWMLTAQESVKSSSSLKSYVTSRCCQVTRSIRPLSCWAPEPVLATTLGKEGLGLSCGPTSARPAARCATDGRGRGRSY